MGALDIALGVKSTDLEWNGNVDSFLQVSYITVSSLIKEPLETVRIYHATSFR